MYIDLILTNRRKCFPNFNVFETGLSDFHELTLTVLKAYVPNQKPRVINQIQKLRIFENNWFKNDLKGITIKKRSNQTS